jgi:RNA polymerase sigma-70 factor (ECF subfamily)
MEEDGHSALRPIAPGIVDALVENHRRFLSFLERRVGNRAAAEEILQSAYGRALEKGVPAEESEGAVPWFFAVLRNAVTDHYRRRAAEARAAESLASAGVPAIADPELRAEVCACFRRLLPTLREEYAEVLERVDLEERPVSEVAADLGITPNSASVRLHPARRALRTQLERSCGVCATHGCLECSCGGGTSIDYRTRPSARARSRGHEPD